MLGDLLRSTDGKVIGSDEGIKLGLLIIKCLVIYSEMKMESNSGFMLEQIWDLYMIL